MTVKKSCALCGKTKPGGASWVLDLRARRDGRITQMPVHYPCVRETMLRQLHAPLCASEFDAPTRRFFRSLIGQGIITYGHLKEHIVLGAYVEARIFPGMSLRVKKANKFFA